MASDKPPHFSSPFDSGPRSPFDSRHRSPFDSPPRGLFDSRSRSHGGGGDGNTGGRRAAGSGSGEVRGDPVGVFAPFTHHFESHPRSHGGGGDGNTGGRAAWSVSGEVRGDRLDWSDPTARRDPYPLLPGHGFGCEEEKSADCHDGCVPKEEYERVLKRLRELGDEFAGYFRASPYNPAGAAMAAMTLKATPRSIFSADGSKAEQHELPYGSPLSSRWVRKSGGGREPADRFQEDFYSHSGRGKGGGWPYGDGCDHLGSSSRPFRGEAVARDSPKWGQREGDWRCSCGFRNFAWRLHCRECKGPLPEHTSGSREGCSFPYASSGSYAGPLADFRAPPVPPSHAPRARDMRKRSRSPTRGALPPKDYGGDLKMKRGRDDRHGPV